MANPPIKARVCARCGVAVFGRYRYCKQCLHEHDREHSYRLKYGLTIADYHALFAKQGGQCAICRKPGEMYGLRVDHNHTTGKVRGLLCNSCNSGLGGLGDSVEALQRALDYLKAAV